MSEALAIQFVVTPFGGQRGCGAVSVQQSESSVTCYSSWFTSPLVYVARAGPRDLQLVRLFGSGNTVADCASGTQPACRAQSSLDAHIPQANSLAGRCGLRLGNASLVDVEPTNCLFVPVWFCSVVWAAAPWPRKCTTMCGLSTRPQLPGCSAVRPTV